MSETRRHVEDIQLVQRALEMLLKPTMYRQRGRAAIEALLRLAAEIERLERDNARLREALDYIEKWQLPPVKGPNGEQSSFEAEYGSNGAREHIRKVARAALVKP